MKDFKILFDYFKEHKIAALAVIIATSMGAGVGARRSRASWEDGRVEGMEGDRK